MQKDNKFFEDLARLSGGIAGGVLEIKKEFEAIASHQVEKLLQKMNVVTREEYDTLHAMLVKSRQEQEEIKKQLQLLTEKINSTSTS